SPRRNGGEARSVQLVVFRTSCVPSMEPSKLQTAPVMADVHGRGHMCAGLCQRRVEVAPRVCVWLAQLICTIRRCLQLRLDAVRRSELWGADDRGRRVGVTPRYLVAQPHIDSITGISSAPASLSR